MKSVYCLNPISNAGMSRFDDTYCIADSIENADAVLLRSASMHEMTLPYSLLAIGRAGAGVNNIPLDSCAKKGIVVFNTPGANANGVKELVIAGLMLASRDIAGGAIGVLVANAASELGMEVFGCDPYLSIQNAVRLSHHITIVKDNDEIYNQCDYITIHVPALDSTKGMLNKRAFDQMKDGVKILNFARDILVSGKVSRYVTDFPNPAVVNMPGALVLPHLGASTEESEENCAVMAVNQIMDYLENGNIENSVNYPSCSLGYRKKAARICVCHYNRPNVISQLTSLFGEAGVNISDMVSKSRGEYAYAMFDVEAPVSDEFEKKLEAMENIIRIRIL